MRDYYFFLDRNSKEKIALRTPQGDLTNTDYTTLLIQQIQQEFEHNLTQQLYVSNELWANLKGFVEVNAMELMTTAQNADKQGENLRETLIQTKMTAESNQNLLIQQIKSEFKDLLL
jgi:isochorismate hydrolase